VSELKTKPNDGDFEAFLNSIENDQRREDCFALLQIFRSVTKCEPQMWGDSIVGFGTYHYKYTSGREGDWFITGFSPRKQNLTLYLLCGSDKQEDLLAELGPHRMGKSCLYLKRLSDAKIPVLKKLLREAMKAAKANHTEH